jgi:hypothetical protein
MLVTSPSRPNGRFAETYPVEREDPLCPNRQPSVPVTDTKLAFAVSPIPSSDGRYRPTPVLGIANQNFVNRTLNAPESVPVP